MRRSSESNQSQVEERRSRGFTLLEVMLAICVILLGLVPLLNLLVRCIHVHQVAESLTQGTLMAESQLSELLAKSSLTEGHYQGRCEQEGEETQYRWSAQVEPLPETVLGPIVESMPLTGLWHVTLILTWAEANKDKEVTLETVVRNPNQSRLQTTGSKMPSEGPRRGTL